MTTKTMAPYLVATALGTMALGLAGCPGGEGGASGDGGSGGGAGAGDEAPGDLVRGGALYDKWWVVLEKPAPDGDHPLWAERPDTESNARTGKDTWRCKECHGWDYAGAVGAYASGSHKTGIAGVLDAAGKDAAELEKAILEGHGYGAAGLSKTDAADLVAFLKGGLSVTAEVVAADKSFIGGTAADGEAHFAKAIGEAKACAECHGADGLESPAGEEGYEDFPGLVARKNPWELLHKIRFGQPGTEMPAHAKNLDAKQLADLGAYLQTLPDGPAGD